MERDKWLVGRQCQKCWWSEGGIVIKGAHTDGWVTITEIAVPLETERSALAAAIVGVNRLTEVVDLIARESLTVKNVES